MAYREFHFEKIYEAPDVGILAEGLMRGAENTSEAIGNLFRGIAEQQRARKAAADQYKFDLGEGKFENDDKIFYQRALNITQRGKNEIKATGQLSPELQKDQEMSVLDKKSSDWQFKTMQQFEKEIEERSKDKYYDPEVDRNKLRVAAYGEDNDVYYGTRGERLEEFAKTRGTDPKSLKGKLFTFDYVGLFRQQEKERKTGSPTAESTVYDKYTFINEQGAPGVTIRHAKDYLNSRPDGSVARWVESLVTDDMDADVRYNKQRSDKFKGMSDDEVKLYLKANPAENLYNKKDFATRVIERAQTELKEAEATSRKVDYTTKVDKTLTGGLYANDAIGHSYTNHVDNTGLEAQGVSDRVASATGININSMPGGILRIAKGAKVGAAIPLDLNPQYSFNMRTGKNETNKGTTPYNLTGYQLGVYGKDGKMKVVDANSIDKIPLSEFKNLEPEMKITLRGYTIDRGNTLGDIAAKQSELDEQLAAAVNAGDMEKEERIRQQMLQINDLKSNMNLSPSEFSDEDLMGSLRRTGISTTSVKKDVLLRASQADIDLLNRNVTRGLDLSDPNKWNDEMVATQDRYKKRAAQAAAAGYQDDVSMEKFAEEMKKKPAKTETKSTQTEVPTITNADDYAKLPAGSQYIDPQGNIRTKKK